VTRPSSLRLPGGERSPAAVEARFPSQSFASAA
jgi:hypothetical protein